VAGSCLQALHIRLARIRDGKGSGTKWISMSQKDELLLLDTLFEHRGNLPAPMEFALIMHERIPLANIFDFVRRHGFV
jgi:hypothetical protein